MVVLRSAEGDWFCEAADQQARGGVYGRDLSDVADLGHPPKVTRGLRPVSLGDASATARRPHVRYATSNGEGSPSASVLQDVGGVALE
jgi:hypothetical protein